VAKIIQYELVRPCTYGGKFYGRQEVGQVFPFPSDAAPPVPEHFLALTGRSEADYRKMDYFELEHLVHSRNKRRVEGGLAPITLQADNMGRWKKAEMVNALVKADSESADAEDEKKKPGRPPKVEPDK